MHALFIVDMVLKVYELAVACVELLSYILAIVYIQ